MERRTQIAAFFASFTAKPKRLGLSVFGCAVVFAMVFAVCLGGKGAGIVLPVGTIELSEVTEKSNYQRSDTDITVENVQQVIESLKRPDAYSASVTNTLYWNGSWETIDAMQYVREGVCLIGFFNTEGNMDRYQAEKNGMYYAWRSGSTTQYSAPAASISADDMSMIPTYEDLIEEEQENIRAAGERTVNGETCIYATVEDAETGYSLTYWVSAVSGLLVQADYNRGRELVRSVVIDSIDPEEPMKPLFLLPSGSNLLEIEE